MMSFPSSDSRFNVVDRRILIVGAWTQTVAHEEWAYLYGDYTRGLKDLNVKYKAR